jgi:Uma2 family endonuclease
MAIDKALTTQQPEEELDDEFEHYYDLHPTKEDLMGESAAQSNLILYLVTVLRRLYAAEQWFIISNLNMYNTRQVHEYPLAPDIAVFKGVVIPDIGARTLRSWRLYEQNRPPPQVVFEFSSKDTWRADLRDKPAKYAALGVLEYHAYEPNNPPYWPKTMGRLRSWRLLNGRMVEQRKDVQGRIWSDVLDSWLVPDSILLRLYDRDGRMRPTEAEAERAAKEAERAAKEAERAAREDERAAKEAERAAKEVERAAKEAERAAKEVAWAKLRELGIDPNDL